MLGARDPLRFVPLISSIYLTTDSLAVHSFKTFFGISLHANGLVLENEDGEVKHGVTFGAQVAFNAATFTAVTTRALDAAGEDVVELLFEADYRTFYSADIVTKENGEDDGLYLFPALTVAPRSILRTNCTELHTDARLCSPPTPTRSDSLHQDRDPIERQEGSRGGSPLAWNRSYSSHYYS